MDLPTLRRLTFYFCILSSSYSIEIMAIRNEKRCGPVDIRNSPKMAFQPRHYQKSWLKYKDCHLLEGDFTISMITHTNITEDMFPVFENLREITGSILVFQIRGLTSLGKMFPNLRIIGGHSLIMNYALVIYQNYDLRDVGLTKLVAIKNGGVRITENPRLCYTRSINWESILVGKIKDVIIDQVAGQCKYDCAPPIDGGLCQRLPSTGQVACWNSTHCQRSICSMEAKKGSGCTDDNQPCHEECLAGCFFSNNNGACYSCRNLDWDGICVSKCPSHLYEQLGRRCLTKTECEELLPVSNLSDKSEWKAFQTNGHKQCHYECPAGFEEDPIDEHKCVACAGYCPKKCAGDTVDSIGSAMKFSKCNIIEGNLEIDMRIGIETTSPEKFTEAFGEIEDITGYLLIRFSSAFMSLHMFKKLRQIQGHQLWKNTYSLVVFENQNLHTLFNTERQQLKILRGKISFQNNRMLCYKKIETLIDHLRMRDVVTENDVSHFSNGDKAICDEIPLHVKIVTVYSYGFVVSWVPFNTSDLDHRKFLGYQIFYKKVDKEDPNMSIDDDRSACSDSWNMQFVTDDSDSTGAMDEDLSSANTPKGELVNQGVEANTMYAVYVQTRLINHPGARNAISKIHFVKTLFGVPDPPRVRESHPVGPHAIKLTWDPPLESYGDVTHYMILWTLAVEYDTLRHDGHDVCEKRASSLHNAKPQSDLISSHASETCPRNLGCCKCEDQTNPDSARLVIDDKFDDARKESSSFEDALQNTIFVQNCEVTHDPHHCPIPDTESSERQQQSPVRAKRHRLAAALASLEIDDNPFTFIKQRGLPSRLRRSISSSSPLESPSDSAYKLPKQSRPSQHLPFVDAKEVNASDINNLTSFNITYSYGKINITGLSIILSGLPHFSEYHVTIYACQDTTAPDNYCSARPAWASVRTDPIPEYDEVDPETVTIIQMNQTEEKLNEKKIYWFPPEKPNGFVLAYRAKLIRDDDSTPLERCIPYNIFENESGVVFSGLSDGIYTLEIRVETSSLLYNNATVIKDFFDIYNPGFFTPKVLAIGAVGLLLLLIVIGLLIYYFMNRMFGKKVEEYWRQTISANPEYLSQMELYKADEWELKREDIILEEEIGRGTFGKVFRSFGKNVHSINGEIFGPCAVKTVAETATPGERLHFLLEASVMKQFNTAFIVKLYGVVSDGQPVLVVMELMEKANLRDFLRSHRPGAEENKDNRPLPRAEQYFDWAAQIADGMAYLESLKFCHRDLAARNCMVHADESVKIGDFGMARDIYYHEYYRPTGKRLMPVRWMAPESLKDGKFTMKSDVWSYGIVLYEMLTLGQQPYAGLGNDQVFNYTGVQRHVLNRPTGCPDFWYGLMLHCWKYDPRERPSFCQVVQHLEDLSSEEFRANSYVITEGIGADRDDDFNFKINLEDEAQTRNLYNEEFVYGLDEEEDDENMGDFVSEENLHEMQRPICARNRRDDLEIKDNFDDLNRGSSRDQELVGLHPKNP